MTNLRYGVILLYEESDAFTLVSRRSGLRLAGFLRQLTLSKRRVFKAMPGTKTESESRKATLKVLRKKAKPPLDLDHAIFQGDVEQFLSSLPETPLFDLVVTSPPYNIGKSYEKKDALETYIAWQKRIIDLIAPRLKPEGSLCWQVGNFVDNGQIVPLDIEFAPIFKSHGLQMRNRIIWHFGHGLHTKRRFSGRYEVVLWYTKTDGYYFDLDAVRVPRNTPERSILRAQRKGRCRGIRSARIQRTSGTSPTSRATMSRRPIIPANSLSG